MMRGRGGGRGRGRGRGTRSHGPARLARSGIRTRGGAYKKFDSQRVRAVDISSDGPSESPDETESSVTPSDLSELESVDGTDSQQPYAALLQSLKPNGWNDDARPTKRRKVEPDPESDDALQRSIESASQDESDSSLNSAESTRIASGEDVIDEDLDDESISSRPAGEFSPYEVHFSGSTPSGSSATVTTVRHANNAHPKSELPTLVISGILSPSTSAAVRDLEASSDISLKPRLKESMQESQRVGKYINKEIAPYILSYLDVLVTNRTPASAPQLRRLSALHAVNHVLIGRSRVLKNNARMAGTSDDPTLELRDQGFTRPKVLILTETRQMCASYAEHIVEYFQPEQQENKQRFNQSFAEPVQQSDMPPDHQELFAGNNDNHFVTTIKFTRKAIKFFSAFYQSDIIMASPLGLRRILEHEDKKKRDFDFLSSIEVVIVDQIDAMQMQSWENVELVFRHLNLLPRELRDCDVNRVRSWYLDGNAKQYRQTILLSAFLTPELNRLFNSELQNTAGKVKVSQSYDGAIQAATGLGLKQIFSRFPSRSPLEDPDARFKFFTLSVLPSLLRIPRPSDGGQGILVFIPSYFDFLRVRNFFATSTMTENVSFGAIHDYSEISEQRRARSHFTSGKHSILLYTQRAHHFFRLRLRGVKRVVMYGIPDNPAFYSELVAGFIGSSLETGTGAGECFSRAMFSKFDAFSMERVVGTSRVRELIAGSGDTFEFV